MLEKLKQILAWLKSGDDDCDIVRKKNEQLRAQLKESEKVVNEIYDYINS